MSEHTKEDCIFCKIAKGDIPCNKVYEDDKTLAFLDISPVSKGHTLVIPKEHAEKIYELSDESSEALAKTLKKISKAVEKALGCDFNVLNNNGEKAGQLVKHVHFHIIPKQDDTGFEYNWDSKKYEEDEDKEILEKIKTNLQF
ncbi:MAG: HIT family protein [Nanoarchaeota archaeon]|nr:HIT family protein [Nanoarchaeota archaeon]